jgi:hypothetical protein
MATLWLLDEARMTGLSLIISLAFGLGQCGVGAFMVHRGAQRGGWRSYRSLLLVLLGAAFALSGLAELIVSGAEALGALRGAPNAAQVHQIRQVVDGLLAGGLAAVALALALYPAWRRIVTAHPTAQQPHKEPS